MRAAVQHHKALPERNDPAPGRVRLTLAAGSAGALHLFGRADRLMM